MPWGEEIENMIKEAREQEPQPLTDCPNCGWNLEEVDGVPHCKFCGWTPGGKVFHTGGTNAF